MVSLLWVAMAAAAAPWSAALELDQTLMATLPPPTLLDARYPDALAGVPPDVWDYAAARIVWGDPDNYAVVRPLGTGRYSAVFLGAVRSGNYSCVIKALKPIAEEKIRREVAVLQHLADGPNIVKVDRRGMTRSSTTSCSSRGRGRRVLSLSTSTRRRTASCTRRSRSTTVGGICATSCARSSTRTRTA